MNLWAALDHLQAGRFTELDTYCNAQQRDYEAGVIDDYTLQQRFSLALISRVDLLPAIEAWVQAFPESYAARHIAAAVQVRVAWQARGSRPASQTSARQFEQMAAHFAQALPHLEAALRLAVKPVLSLVEWNRIRMTGACVDLPDHSAAFETMLPQSPLLCGRKLGALNPKWSGDEAALGAFMTCARGWPWTDAQRKALEAAYLVEQADILRCQGEFGRALQRIDEALALRRSASALSAKADLHALRNENPAAARSYQESLDLMPDGLDYYSLGYAYADGGQNEAATDAYRKALAMGHGDAASALVWQFHDRAHDPAVFRQIDAWFEQGFAHYSGAAMLARGNFHCHGHGYAKDPNEVGRWWYAAGEWGNSTAWVNLALFFWDGREGFAKNYQKALQAATAAAELGDEESWDIVGRMHYQGHGTPVDYAKALPYLQAAAEKGEARSIGCLVRAHWFGHGTPVDRDTARAWLEQLRQIDADEYQYTKGQIMGPVGWLRTGIASLRQK